MEKSYRDDFGKHLNKDDDSLKIYVTDTGLFTTMLEEGTVDNIINGDLKVYKVAIFENKKNYEEQLK